MGVLDPVAPSILGVLPPSRVLEVSTSTTKLCLEGCCRIYPMPPDSLGFKKIMGFSISLKLFDLASNMVYSWKPILATWGPWNGEAGISISGIISGSPPRVRVIGIFVVWDFYAKEGICSPIEVNAGADQPVGRLRVPY